MNTTAGLKPCPFCGLALKNYGHDAAHHEIADCPLSDFVIEGPQLGDWNTRTPEASDTLEMVVEALKSTKAALLETATTTRTDAGVVCWLLPDAAVLKINAALAALAKAGAA